MDCCVIRNGVTSWRVGSWEPGEGFVMRQGIVQQNHSSFAGGLCVVVTSSRVGRGRFERRCLASSRRVRSEKVTVKKEVLN